MSNSGKPLKIKESRAIRLDGTFLNFALFFKKSALFLLIKSILGRFLLRKPDLSAAAATYPPQLTLIKLSFLLDLNFSNYASGS